MVATLLIANILFIFVDGLLGSDPANSVKDCPLPYDTVGSRCVLVDNQPIGRWSDAKFFCERIGGTLLKLDSADFMADLVDYIYANALTNVHYWIGGSDSAEEGKWVWLDGTPVRLGTPFWDIKEETRAPNGGTTQNCAYLYPGHYYYINDWDCDNIA